LKVLRQFCNRIGALFSNHQSFRFVIVGAFNTTIAYCLYALFIFLDFSVAAASDLSLVINLGISFTTQGSIVFGHLSFGALLRFIVVWLSMYALYVLTVLTLKQYGLNAYAGGLVATVLVTLVSFFLQRHLVFRSGRR